MLHKVAFAMICVGATSAHAVGLGNIQLQSGLGQPLRAVIPLTKNDASDLSSACVRARLEYSDGTFLLTPRISLTHNAQSGVIDITTRQSINEPAVLLHVETGCGTSISRNYQLLLDPLNTKAAAHARSQGHIEAKAATPSSQNPGSPRASHVNASKQTKVKTAQVAQLATLTKEMSLSSHANGTRRRSASQPNDAKWISEDSITPNLKLSGSLADASDTLDAQKAEEFRAAQLRFAAIINGEDVTQNAEVKMKSAQEKVRLLEAENEQKKQQANAERLAQENKRKVSFPIAWFAALAGLLLICVAVILWLASKIKQARKAPAPHPWKNYNAASDTLIADLSTQTLLDSEFLTTMGPSYNTAVFSDTQFDPDLITDGHELNDADLDLEDDELDTHEPVADEVAAPVTLAPVEETPSARKPADAPKATSTPVAEQDASLAAPPIESPANRQTAAPSNTSTASSSFKSSLEPSKPDTRGMADAPAPLPARPASPAAAPAASTAAPRKQKSAPTLKVKEIADLMQQAEFWMLLQDPFRAIEILEPYRDVDQPESPVPWIYLLDLYRMVGDKKKYETLLVRIEYVFNAKIPRWDGQFGITPRSLNDFPHVVEKICALWETDEIVPYLESLLLDKRDGTRQGFDLPVYRNIIQLITLAREPEKSKAHELRYGKAQAILFSQQTPVPDPATAEAAAAPQPKPHPVAPPVAEADPVPQTSVAVAENVQPAAKAAEEEERELFPAIAQAGAPVASPTMDNSEPADIASADSENASPMETKLELALAYQEIGEKDGARELLYEVIKDGSPAQSEKAKLILKAIN
jgi:FimV-like protein